MINYKKLIQAVDLIREVLLELDENEIHEIKNELPEGIPLVDIVEPEEVKEVEEVPSLFPESSVENKPEEVKLEVDATFPEDPRPSVDPVAPDNVEDVKPDLSKMTFKELREFYQKNQRKKVK